MLAPGNTAADASVTRPVMVEVPICAQDNVAKHMESKYALSIETTSSIHGLSETDGLLLVPGTRASPAQSQHASSRPKKESPYMMGCLITIRYRTQLGERQLGRALP